MVEPANVLVVDDESLVREGIVMLLSADPDIEVVGSTGDSSQVVPLVKETQPDVVVMDIRMPGLDGVEATKQILAEEHASPNLIRVLMLTSFHDGESLQAALRNGASGFLLKSSAPGNLPEAIKQVAQGNAWLDPVVTRDLISEFANKADPALPTPEKFARLTPRETQVLVLLAHGLGTGEIVEHLFINQATVKTHISRMLVKLGLRDRAQAVAAAYQNGLVQPGDSVPT